MRRALTAAILTISAVSAQSIVTAKAGLVHLIEGEVRINGVAAEQRGEQFLSLRDNDVLSTRQGRAEVLLQPGSFLRIAERSSFRLVSADLDDTRLEVLSGSALVEVSELPQDTAVSILFHGASVNLKKRGLYEFTADVPARFGCMTANSY